MDVGSFRAAVLVMTVMFFLSLVSSSYTDVDTWLWLSSNNIFNSSETL